MNERIDSLKNPRVKHVRSLRRAKHRKKEGQFVIEGRKIVEEAIRDCPDAVQAVYATREQAKELTFPITEVSSRVYAQMSGMQEPPGMLAVLRTAAIPHTKKDRTLLLDGISDPGNLGTLLRTAEAFSFSVCLTEDCADPLNPKTVQASMGSILRHMPATLSMDEIRQLAETRTMIGATLGGIRPGELAVDYPVLVLGSESHGIREEILRILDQQVTIPMNGANESLNVAVAGGILMAGLGSGL